MSHFCDSLSTKAGWAFTTYNDEPMQDFGPKMGGGRMLRSGRLLGTLRYYVWSPCQPVPGGMLQWITVARQVETIENL